MKDSTGKKVTKKDLEKLLKTDERIIRICKRIELLESYKNSESYTWYEKLKESIEKSIERELKELEKDLST